MEWTLHGFQLLGKRGKAMQCNGDENYHVVVITSVVYLISCSLEVVQIEVISEIRL